MPHRLYSSIEIGRNSVQVLPTSFSAAPLQEKCSANLASTFAFSGIGLRTLFLNFWYLQERVLFGSSGLCW